MLCTIGIVAAGTESFPNAGRLLSTFCQSADGYDAASIYWSGSWTSVGTYADGSGGSYNSTIGDNINGCWHPAGYTYYTNNYDLQHNWNHGTHYGIFTYGYHYESTYSNGAGGVLGGSSDSISATNGQIVHSYGFTDGATGYPMTSYLYFSTADNQLHENNYINAGTNVGENCYSEHINDASGSSYYVSYKLVAYADGAGGSYYGPHEYNTTMCGYLPNGFWESYTSNYETLIYYDENSSTQTFQYGNFYYGYRSDGFGGNYYESNIDIWYLSGFVFYSFYDLAGFQTINYAFDGSSGYYTYPS